MARPRQPSTASLATSERLLLAAEEAFATHGYEGARLSDIAEAVGISRPSLLYHFASKELLYAAVVRTAFLRLGEGLSFAVEGRDGFAERWARAVENVGEFLDDRPALAKIILREVLTAGGAGHAILLQAGIPVLERMERFVRREGASHVPPGYPLREAMLQIVSAALLKAAAGPLRAAFWGPEERSSELARLMLLGPGSSRAAPTMKEALL